LEIKVLQNIKYEFTEQSSVTSREHFEAFLNHPAAVGTLVVIHHSPQTWYEYYFPYDGIPLEIAIPFSIDLYRNCHPLFEFVYLDAAGKCYERSCAEYGHPVNCSVVAYPSTPVMI
jgi:hypothetical protein